MEVVFVFFYPTTNADTITCFSPTSAARIESACSPHPCELITNQLNLHYPQSLNHSISFPGIYHCTTLGCMDGASKESWKERRLKKGVVGRKDREGGAQHYQTGVHMREKIFLSISLPPTLPVYHARMVKPQHQECVKR